MPRKPKQKPTPSDFAQASAQAGAVPVDFDGAPRGGTAALIVEWWPLDRVRPAEDNPRNIPPEAVAAVAESVRAFGWRQPLIVDASGVLIAGHTRLLAAAKLDLATVPVVVARDLSPDEARALRIVDNRAGDLSTWNALKLGEALEALPAMLDLNLDPFDFDGLLASLSPPGDLLAPGEGEGLTRGNAEATPDPRPDVPPDSKRGVVYELGPHRVGCGSAGDPELVARVLGGAKLDGILMDPPYCSGGFPEAGKHSGSIGSKRKDGNGKDIAPRIMGDNLSTRGFQALIRGAFDVWAPPVAFTFTDWRMWIPLYDLTEASGLGVRSMIVWDKGHPGMGRGFRAQHELVMLSVRGAGLAVFDPKASRGNVIQCKRSGNPLHPTQKPVELLVALLGVSTFMRNVGDPFGGSGSTLMAAAQAGRVAYLTELDPVFVDVIRRRWTTFAKDNGVEPGTGVLV